MRQYLLFVTSFLDLVVGLNLPHQQAYFTNSLKPIVLFDGECSLCDHWVNFLIENDPDRELRFAPIHSQVGRQLLTRAGLPTDITQIVLLDAHGAWTKSEAILEIGRRIEWQEYNRGVATAALALGACFPVEFRDAVVDLVSAHRHRFVFDDDDLCRAPRPDDHLRFLEDDDDEVIFEQRHFDAWTPFSSTNHRVSPHSVEDDDLSMAAAAAPAHLDVWAPPDVHRLR